MRHIVLGTAGHVDHGKTSLIKSLTGIDTDRLKEEKERGITIELGFAHLTLPSGNRIGIVDVPGHERFIKTMVSGATGIDLVSLVIAADEGVMPQTREHLQICSLLGINKGLVALTKIDLVEKDWLELVISDIKDFLQGTFLENAALIPLSSATGTGLKEFLAALNKLASEVEEEYDPGVLRLPVDRVFTMKGFGTVVTGTISSGSIKTGDSVHILPQRLPAKVRGIQIHNEASPEAQAGQRAAVNLQGADKNLLARGDVMAHPGYFEPSLRLDVHLEYLPGTMKKLKNRNLVRFHIGTSETMARVVILDRDEIEPGQNCFAQLFLASPAVTIAKDRFVLRSYSPVTTIGGGEVIDPNARKLKRMNPATLDDLGLLYRGTAKTKVHAMIKRSDITGVTLGQLVVKTGFHINHLGPLVDCLLAERQAFLVDSEEKRVIAEDVYRRVQGQILHSVADYHQKNPYKQGIIKEELRGVMGQAGNSKLFHRVLKDLEDNKKIISDRDIIKLYDYRVVLKDDLEEIKGKITSLYLETGLTPPDGETLAKQFFSRENIWADIFRIMIKEGIIVRIKEDYHVHRQALDGLQEDYRNLLLEKGKAAPQDFKELTGLSRKYSIPLMEYFDMIKFTIRSGEHRILKNNQKG